MLVDGLDFSDDKMLVGRTFSYSDTQRLPGRAELPAAAGEPGRRTPVATNQRDGQMTYGVDSRPATTRTSTTSRPSSAGCARRQYPTHDEQGPVIAGRLTRKRIPRTNDYQQAGERYLLSEQWEKDDLVANLVDALSQCDRPIQERMVWHFFMCEDELGQRVGDGLGISARRRPSTCRRCRARPSPRRSEQRRRTWARTARRDVAGTVMTHCVPNERGVPQD